MAELCAARIDGELFAVDECFAPVDAVDSSALRGAALLALTGPRAVAVLESALWVHGVLLAPPETHEVRVPRRSRARLPQSPRLCSGERTFAPGEIQRLGGMAVTTVPRTVLDLLFAEDFDRVRRRIVAAVLAEDTRRATHCAELVRTAVHRPGKRRALQRISDLMAVKVDAPGPAG